MADQPAKIDDVSNTATKDQLGASVRTVLAAVGGWAVGKGWINSDTASAIVSVAMIGLPLIWGQLKARYTHDQRKAMATLLPDTVVQIKP